jgi:glycogen operon protein
MLVDGRAQVSGVRRRGQDATLLVVFNAFYDMVEFTLPRVEGGEVWRLRIDTNQPGEDGARFQVGEVYKVTGRSLLLLQRQAAEDAELPSRVLPAFGGT